MALSREVLTRSAAIFSYYPKPKESLHALQSVIGLPIPDTVTLSLNRGF
jgi:hypothetical protein